MGLKDITTNTDPNLSLLWKDERKVLLWYVAKNKRKFVPEKTFLTSDSKVIGEKNETLCWFSNINAENNDQDKNFIAKTS